MKVRIMRIAQDLPREDLLRKLKSFEKKYRNI